MTKLTEDAAPITIDYDSDGYLPFRVGLARGTVHHYLPPMDLYELEQLEHAIRVIKEKAER